MSFFSSGKFVWVYFACALVVLTLLYFPAHRAMLVDDGINGLLVLKNRGFEGFWKSYDTNCFYYAFWSFLWILYSICKTNTVFWFAFFACMHALNTVLVFLTFKKLYRVFLNGYDGLPAAWMGSLFFLFSPFMSENILWTATHHYAICCAIFLWSVHYLIGYIIGEKLKHGRALFVILFVLAITTLEISFFFPIFYLLLFGLFSVTRSNRISFLFFCKTILLPLIIICLIYLLALYFSKGILIPHYYANEVQFRMADMAGHFISYQYKFWLHVNHLDIKTRDLLYTTSSHWLWGLSIYAGFTFCIFLLIFKRNRNRAWIFLFLILSSVLLLLPVLHLQFTYLFTYENDRYLYFFSLFAFQVIVWLVFQLKAYLRYPLLLAYLAIGIYYCFKSAVDKKVAANYIAHYVDRFEDKADGRTFIFNMPYVVQNQRLFYYMDGFTQLYELIHRRDIHGRVFNILGVVCYTENNKIDVFKVSDSSFSFQLRSDGEWFRRDPNGSLTYEKESHFRCEVNEWNSVLLTIFNRLPGDRILIFEKGIFREIRL